jgi:hypothetical protein
LPRTCVEREKWLSVKMELAVPALVVVGVDVEDDTLAERQQPCA